MARTKEDMSHALDSLRRKLKNGNNKKTFPIPLLDSLWSNLKKARTKEDISYASLSFSLEEQRRHAPYLYLILFGGTCPEFY
jgi:hypothetical protein